MHSSCWEIFLWSAVLFEITLATLQSGSFVPLVEHAGPLACPQSLRTLDGLGHCVNITPLAAIKTKKFADIFVQCSAQMKAPQVGTNDQH